jgi:hypothetical protein
MTPTDVLQCPARRCRCIDQVWVDTVVASRDAAIRDRDIALRELTRLRALIEDES